MEDRTDASFEEAEQEVLDGIEDRISEINRLLQEVREGSLDATVGAGLIRQHAHSIKSMAAGINVGILQVLAHRLEDFLAPLERLEGETVGDVQVFADRLGEALDGRLDAGPDEIASFCRRLPAKKAGPEADFDPSEVRGRDIEVMLVSSPGAATNFVTRELAECGYRMVNCFSTIDALILVPQMKPDLVIVSNVMPELPGVDFACAMRAMPSTRDIPVAVLTSERRDSRKLAGLPADVPLLSKSARFGDDVTKVFQQLGLL